MVEALGFWGVLVLGLGGGGWVMGFGIWRLRFGVWGLAVCDPCARPRFPTLLLTRFQKGFTRANTNPSREGGSGRGLRLFERGCGKHRALASGDRTGCSSPVGAPLPSLSAPPICTQHNSDQP